MKEMRTQNTASHRPQKDQCNMCTRYKHGNVFEEELMKQAKRKEAVRLEKASDKRMAQEQRDLMVLTTDLQIVLLATHVFATANCYKIKLCCHNFSIYTVSSHDINCYFWHEGQCELRSDSFASCILDYLQSTVDDSVSTVLLHSDGCCYKNRLLTRNFWKKDTFM